MDIDGDQDDAIDLPSGTTRRSPRICVRKVKPFPSVSPCSPKSEPKKCRKRKKVSSEDDPNYSEVEDEDELSQHHKKVPGYRCSPHLIPELMEKLSDKQKEWVKNIRWDSLQHMIDSRMPKCLTMWLVDRVDTSNGTLEVCGTPIDIKKAIGSILKLPCGHIKVPPPLNGRSKVKRAKGDSSHPDHKHSDNGRGKTAKDATKDLLKENDDEAEFCRSYVMLVLCTYLAPTTSLNINRNYYPSLMDVSKIPLMDWCGFIADYLIQGIEDSRNSSKSHVQVPGCVHILPLLYVDALIKMKALHFPEALTLPEGEPRIHFIGTDHLAYLASVDVKSRSKERVEYGLLQDSWMSDRAVPPSSPSSKKYPAPKIPPDSTSFPPSFYNNNPQQVSAKEFLGSLFKEIKHSRDEIVHKFQQQMVESDSRILALFERKFVDHFSASLKEGTFEENIMVSPVASPFQSGKNAPSNGPQDPDLQDISEIPISEDPILPSHGMQPNLNSMPPTPSDSDHVLGHQTCPSASFVPPPTIVQPAVESSPSDNTNRFPTNYQPHNIDSPPQKAIHSIPKETSYDEFVDVVSIGAAAAHDVVSNNQFDEDPSCVVISNLEAPAKYDQSPACPSMSHSPSIPKIIAQKCSSQSVPSPLFTSDAGSQAGPSFSPIIKGPAIFDSSPSTPLTLNDETEVSASGAKLCPHQCSELLTKAEPKCPADTKNELDMMLNVFDGAIISTMGNLTIIVATVQNLTNRVVADSESNHSPGSPQSISRLLTNYSQSSGVVHSDSQDESESDELHPEESADDIEDDTLFDSNPGCTPTPPSYTYDSEEVIDIPDDPVVPPSDIIHIPPLQEELQGFRFKLGGSVTIATCKMFDKLKQLEKDNPLVVAILKTKFVLSKDAKKTYQDHILNSKARVSSRHRTVNDPNRQRCKIQIKRFHITKGEFVDALKPNGEVCQALMGLCSVAIMTDWETKTKIILNQQIIVDLLKPGPQCDQMSIAANLKKLPLDEINEIFVPILNNRHWFLAVVDLVNEIVEFYDSLLVVKDGEHPHKDLWTTLSGNLQEAYCTAKKRSVFIEFFECRYPGNKLQTTNHDCGFHVIQELECHKSEDIVGHSKKSITAYRKYLSHILVYHRFNDLNPLRPCLREEIP